MELKKLHPSRLVRRVETQNKLVPHPHMVDKNLGEISRAGRSPAPHQNPYLAQGSSVRKINLHNFWLQTPAEIELVEESSGVPKGFLLKNPHTDLPRLSLSSSTGVAA